MSKNATDSGFRLALWCSTIDWIEIKLCPILSFFLKAFAAAVGQWGIEASHDMIWNRVIIWFGLNPVKEPHDHQGHSYGPNIFWQRSIRLFGISVVVPRFSFSGSSAANNSQMLNRCARGIEGSCFSSLMVYSRGNATFGNFFCHYLLHLLKLDFPEPTVLVLYYLPQIFFQMNSVLFQLVIIKYFIIH